MTLSKMTAQNNQLCWGLKSWGIFFIYFILTACATTQTTPTTVTNEVSQKQKQAIWDKLEYKLRRMGNFDIRAKIGVRTGVKGGSATLKWEYRDRNNQDIELYGPFGGGRVIITVTSDGAELRDTKGNTLTGATASDVLYQRLGWHIPFSQLAEWIKGLSGETATELTLSDEGRLEYFVQDSWQVKYQRFESHGTAQDAISLPTKFTISAAPGTVKIYSNKGKYLGDNLNIKVIIKKWYLGPIVKADSW